MALVLKHKRISKLRQITEILGHNFRAKISIRKLNFFFVKFVTSFLNTTASLGIEFKNLISKTEA